MPPTPPAAQGRAPGRAAATSGAVRRAQSVPLAPRTAPKLLPAASALRPISESAESAAAEAAACRRWAARQRTLTFDAVCAYVAAQLRDYHAHFPAARRAPGAFGNADGTADGADPTSCDLADASSAAAIRDAIDVWLLCSAALDASGAESSRAEQSDRALAALEAQADGFVRSSVTRRLRRLRLAIAARSPALAMQGRAATASLATLAGALRASVEAEAECARAFATAAANHTTRGDGHDDGGDERVCCALRLVEREAETELDACAHAMHTLDGAGFDAAAQLVALKVARGHCPRVPILLLCRYCRRVCGHRAFTVPRRRSRLSSDLRRSRASLNRLSGWGRGGSRRRMRHCRHRCRAARRPYLTQRKDVCERRDSAVSSLASVLRRPTCATCSRRRNGPRAPRAPMKRPRGRRPRSSTSSRRCSPHSGTVHVPFHDRPRVTLRRWTRW